MLKDTIDKVKAAEIRADEIIAQARRDAEEIIEKAGAQAEVKSDETIRKANDDAKAALNSAQEASVTRLDAAAADTEKEIAEMKALAADKQAAAVDAVIEKILA